MIDQLPASRRPLSSAPAACWWARTTVESTDTVQSMSSAASTEARTEARIPSKRHELGRSPDRGCGSTRLPVRASSGGCRWGVRCRVVGPSGLFPLRSSRCTTNETPNSPPEGAMGEIYRKLSLSSPAPPNAPKCNRHLIPHTMTRDTTWRMRVPDRAGLTSVSSPCRSPEAIYPTITGQLTSGFHGSVVVQRDSAT